MAPFMPAAHVLPCVCLCVDIGSKAQSETEAFLSSCSAEERGGLSVSYLRLVRDMCPLLWSQQEELPPLLAADAPAEGGQERAEGSASAAAVAAVAGGDGGGGAPAAASHAQGAVSR